MSGGSWAPQSRPGGFTLIEVIGALVIFSVGVLMVMQVSGALGTQMRFAGIRSEIVVLANERLDSLEVTPLASLVAGTARDTVVVQGLGYERTAIVTLLTPVLAKIEVSLEPVDGVGPSHEVVSYTSEPW